MPILRWFGGMSRSDSPRSHRSPLSQLSKPAMMFRSVVLPHPLGPRRATISPRRTVRLQSRTARTVPNDFSIPSTLRSIASAAPVISSPSGASRPSAKPGAGAVPYHVGSLLNHRGRPPEDGPPKARMASRSGRRPDLSPRSRAPSGPPTRPAGSPHRRNRTRTDGRDPE